MVSTTVFVLVSISEIVSEPPLATYTKSVFGVTTIPCGALPTVTVAMTLFFGSFAVEELMNGSCATAGATVEETMTKANAVVARQTLTLTNDRIFRVFL